MLHQILCYVKFHAASYFMLRQISCCIKFYATSNFMLHQISCCIKFYATICQISCCIKFHVPTSIVRCGLGTTQENEATRFPPKRLLWLFVNMAESEEGGSPVEFSTAISLLSQATNILSGLNNPTNTNTTSATTSSTPKVFSRVSLHHDDNGVLTNFRNLFSPYGNVPSSSSARSGPCASSRGSTKRRFQPYKVKETWTHEFFCLSNQQQERVPSKVEKLQLQE